MLVNLALLTEFSLLGKIFQVVDSVIVNIFSTRLNTASLSQYGVVVYSLYNAQTLTVLHSVNMISRSQAVNDLYYIILCFILY